MADYNTGIETSLANADFTTGQNKADLVISERRNVTIHQLSFFADETAKITSFCKTIGFAGLPDFSQLIATKQHLQAARVEIGKIWLIGDGSVANVPASFYPLKISSSKVILRLSGVRASDVIARICAVDFRDDKRNFMATGIHHVPCHIFHEDGVFDIYMPRSFAQSLTDLILDISAQYHVQMA